jgi:cell division septal protein FtsQ
VTLDPRIAKRRSDVHQDSARSSIRRLLRWILIGGLITAVGWFAQSSSFQVQEILVTGVSNSQALEILDREGVLLDQPLLRVRPSRAEEVLLTDPWIQEATVEIRFPNTISVVVRERTGVAWVTVGSAYMLVADDGVAVDAGPEPGANPLLELGGVAVPRLGEVFADSRVRGLAEFMASLPGSYAAQAVATERGGELWVSLAEFDIEVRLGRPVDMEKKAAVLAGLMQDGLPPGAIVHLIAPERPAIESR